MGGGGDGNKEQFREVCTAKDLWKVCNDYGTVVDVFIPNKKSKVGKRFAFVRFIKATNLDRLIENLNTIWIGRFHLFANPVRFERPKKPNLSSHKYAAAASSYPRGVDQTKGQVQSGSYVNVVNGPSLVVAHGPSISSASALVLDDSCVVERDLSNHVMGKVKDVSSISNLRTLITEEGFFVVNLVYLGGIPLNIWSRETFTRIGKKWGEALDIEDNVDSSFRRKRLCIKTNQPLSILESFKVVFKDRSQFCEEGSGDDSVSDVEEVSETIFGDNSSIPINHMDESEKQQSEDPFNIYRLLRKQPGGDSHEVSSSLSHPPGFTPDVSVIRNENGQSAKEVPVVVNAKVMNNSQDVSKEASCDNVDPNVVKNGGSVLGVMEDMIRVGKAMGYSMDGCVKDLEHIIGTQGVGDVHR
ncbi:RNA-directed DNA polymerase, eukaryota [Tanacetum coccineum]